MAYAFIQDVPINAHIYRQVVEGLGENPPDGLITHIAIERPEGGVRYIDVWRSEADWDRFAEERLHPVIHPILTAKLGVAPPEPPRDVVTVIDVWNGESAGRLVPAGS